MLNSCVTSHNRMSDAYHVILKIVRWGFWREENNNFFLPHPNHTHLMTRSHDQ